MTHIFQVTPEQFKQLGEHQRHLTVKDDANIATGDTAIIQCDRDQVTFTIQSVEHGQQSKVINSHYCLLGLFSPHESTIDADAPRINISMAAPLPGADTLHY